MHYHFLLLWRLLSCLVPSVQYMQMLKDTSVDMGRAFTLHTLRWAPRLSQKVYSNWVQVCMLFVI